MNRRGILGALVGGLVSGAVAVVRGRGRQVWDVAIPGHNEEFMALGYRGVLVDGRPVKALRIDLARGEVEIHVRDLAGHTVLGPEYPDPTDPGAFRRDLKRATIKGRVTLTREATA